MKPFEYTFFGRVWKYEGKCWRYFISVPQDLSVQISDDLHTKKRWWGSIPVTARTGMCTWQKAVFPGKTQSYILPLKVEVRRKEHLSDGDNPIIILQLRGMLLKSKEST